MTQKKKTEPSWLPYLFLLLIPVMLVGLDSYGWLFTHPPTVNEAIGLWPRILSADLPHKLQLLLPSKATVPDHLEILHGNQIQSIEPEIKGEHWQITLPAMPAGQYRLQLKHHQTNLGLAYPLEVTPTPFWQLRNDRQVYQPGDWMIASLRIGSTAPIAQNKLQLEVRGSRDELLWQQVLPSQPGLTQYRIQLPEGLDSGQGSILLRQGTHPLELRPFTLLSMPNQTSTMQLIPDRRQLLANISQTLKLNLLDNTGQRVESGWVRMLGKTLPIQMGTVSLTLPNAEKEIEFAAGDSRGNLLQGSLTFEVLETDWMPQFNIQNQLEILSSQKQTFNWILGQNNKIVGSGLVEIDPSHHTIDLPALNDTQALWMEICDIKGKCQQIQWLPQLGTGQWSMRPAYPHALEPVRIQSEVTETGLIESFRGLETRQGVTLPKAGSTPFQIVGKVSPVKEHPFMLSFWAFMALTFPLLPLFWIYPLLSPKYRPFPTELRRKLSRHAQLWSLSATGISVIGLTISWMGYFMLSACISLVAGMLIAGYQAWKVRQLFHPNHPFLAWLPMFQSIMLGLAMWFCLTYQPAVLGACLLSFGLYGLIWNQIWQKWVPLTSMQHPRILTLATLVVAAVSHTLILPSLNLPSPVWLSVQSDPLLRSTAVFPVQRLLDHQIWPAGSSQILQAARRSGSQLLHLRYWSDDAGIKDMQQQVHVQMATLAELHLPDYALVGDHLQLPIRFINETSQKQDLLWRLNQGPQQALSLPARMERSLPQETDFKQEGWQSIQLEHQFKGKWYTQNQRIYVQSVPNAHLDPRVQVRIDVPEASHLVPGEEIPVMVHLHQTSGRHAAVGLQIGIPASFEALTDTLGARARRTWLMNFEERPGQLNLQTLVLANGQEISFHFRIRATMVGRVQMPPARIFLMDQPEIETIYPVTQWLETIPDH